MEATRLETDIDEPPASLVLLHFGGRFRGPIIGLMLGWELMGGIGTVPIPQSPRPVWFGRFESWDPQGSWEPAPVA